ncbi:MAG: hypothetical protein P4L87_21105 [Formivibrio sp.]|nr:hypothetical protein [Formivibrio sp.]
MAYVDRKARAEESWETYWETRAIPILEVSKNSLQLMLRRAERVRPADVAKVVLADPLLTLQALRYIGRRERSSLAADVVSIEKIVMLTGTVPFLEQFCSLPTVESVLQPHSADDYNEFLQELYLCRFSARLALAYADWRYDARPEEVATAAILSRGHLLLYLLRGKQSTHSSPQGTDLCRFLTHLNIPFAVVQLLDPADNLPPRAILQQAVLRLVDAFQLGWWQRSVQEELALIASILEVETAAVWQALCRVALFFAQDPARWPQITHPARWLPMLPGDWSMPAVVASKPIEMNLPLIKPDPLQQHMQTLHLICRQGLPAKDIILHTVQALSAGLGMRRIVFAVQAPGQSELRVRYVLGVPTESHLRHLTIKMDGSNIFSRLMEKPQGLWINESNAVRVMPSFPSEFRACYQAEQFCIMSIFAGTKPLGIMIADLSGSDCLTEYHYQHFKQICVLAMKALARDA